MCVCPVVIEREGRGKGGERREEEKKVKFVPVENGADRGRNLLLPMIQLDPDDKRRHLLLEANHHERWLYHLHTHPTHTQTATMSLLRTSRLLTTSRARLQIVPNLTAAATRAGSRPFSSTIARSGGDHAHENRYDPPGGWLFGVKPGEQYENEGWEKVWFYGFGGCMAFMVIGYCYKPDTR